VAAGGTLQEMQSRITFASTQCCICPAALDFYGSGDSQLWFFSKRAREFLAGSEPGSRLQALIHISQGVRGPAKPQRSQSQIVTRGSGAPKQKLRLFEECFGKKQQFQQDETKPE
jgi:hypothetical protein